MTDRVSIPVRAFSDRKIRGAHLRLLAAVDQLGDGCRLSLEALFVETGIEKREIRRLRHDLEAWGYLDVRQGEGEASVYTVRFSAEGEGKKSPGEVLSPGEEKVSTPGVAPLGSPPKDPGPQNTPPLIPPSPEKVTRAARLPEDWQPSGDDLAYAENIGLREIPRHVEDFRDYWQARAGPEARKLNWSKTWRVRCRTLKGWQDEADRRQGGRGAGGGAAADAQRRRLQSALVSAALAGDVAGDDAGPGFGR